MTATPHKALRRWSQIAVIAGIAALVVVLVTAKGQPAGTSSSAGPVAVTEAPEVALDRALAASQPTLAFFHSTTCDSCIEMTAIVAEVYPEFQGKVTLVDVDVYEDRNEALLSRARIVSIPTLVLFDRAGASQWYPGVMDADQLREHLQALAGGG